VTSRKGPIGKETYKYEMTQGKRRVYIYTETGKETCGTIQLEKRPIQKTATNEKRHLQNM